MEQKQKKADREELTDRKRVEYDVMTEVMIIEAIDVLLAISFSVFKLVSIIFVATIVNVHINNWRMVYNVDDGSFKFANDNVSSR